MPADLITLDRAKRAFPGLLGTTQDLVIGGLITAVSRAAEKYCKRIFSLQWYDECYDTDGTGSLLLRKFPVVAISRLASTLTQILTVQNNDQVTNSRATVGTQQPGVFDVPTPSIGLSLTRVAAGITYNDISILWSTYPTVVLVAAAVTAMGNGWQGIATTLGYAGWASNDITPIMGAQGCLGGQANLYVHATDLSDWQLIDESGEIRFGLGLGGFFGTGWQPGDGSGLGYEPGITLPRGGRNIRVVYQAGFAIIPEDLQEAIALWVAHRFQNNKSAGDYTMERLGDHQIERDINMGPPKHVKTMLDQYKDYKV